MATLEQASIIEKANRILFSSSEGVNMSIKEDNCVYLGDLKVAELSQSSIDSFASVKQIMATYLGYVRPEKLNKVIYRNHDRNVIAITSGSEQKVKFVDELSVEFQALIGQFHAMCDVIKPDFGKLEWTSPDSLAVDEILLSTTTDLTQEQMFLVFQIGEMCKAIIAE